MRPCDLDRSGARHRSFVLPLLLVFPLAAAADVLVVLNKSDHQAALVNPATYEVLAKLPTGKGPHEVAASPDGRYAYVSNYGLFGVFRQGEPPQREPGADAHPRQVHAGWQAGVGLECAEQHRDRV